jgi:hypothetical protein
VQVILSYFWQICLFRAGPEKIPQNMTVTALCTFVFFFTQITYFLLTNPELLLFQMLGIIFFGFMMETAIIYGLLRFKNVSYRFLGTLSAFLGSNSILIVMSLFISLMSNSFDDGLIGSFIEALALICFFWWLGIFGFILNRATGISMLQGTVLAFIIELVVVLSTRSIFLPSN